jgi:hypothetical protein
VLVQLGCGSKVDSVLGEFREELISVLLNHSFLDEASASGD